MASFYTALLGMERYINTPSSFETAGMYGGISFAGGFEDGGSIVDSYGAGYSNPFGGAFADFFRGFGRQSSFVKSFGGDAKATFKSTIEESWNIKPPVLFGDANAGGYNGAPSAMQAPAMQTPSSTTNVDATSGTDRAENEEISEESREEAVRTLQGKGYSKPEAQSIVDRMATAAEDRSDFASMLGSVPRKSTTGTDQQTGQTTTVQNPRWVEDFGKWFAENVLHMEDPAAASAYVHGVAFSEYVRPASNSGPYASVRPVGTQTVEIIVNGAKVNAKEYEVTNAGETGLAQGARIYRVGNNGNAKWYVNVGETYYELPCRSAGTGNNTKLYIGSGDHMDVTPAGTETRDNKVYEIYNVVAGTASGSVASAVTATTLYYRSDNHKWYTKNEDGSFTELTTQPTSFAGGRITFGTAPTYVPIIDGTTTAQEYMRLMDTGSATATSAASALSTQEDDQDTQKIQATHDAIEAQFAGTDNRGLQAEVIDGGIRLTCTPETAGALAGTLATPAAQTILNDLLRGLPSGTQIFYGDIPIVGANPAARIYAEVKADEPRELTIGALDLSSVSGTDEEIRTKISERLEQAVRQAMLSQRIDNPTELDFSDVVLPEGITEDDLRPILTSIGEKILFEGRGTVKGNFFHKGENEAFFSEMLIIDDTTSVTDDTATASSDAASEADTAAEEGAPAPSPAAAAAADASTVADDEPAAAAPAPVTPSSGSDTGSSGSGTSHDDDVEDADGGVTITGLVDDGPVAAAPAPVPAPAVAIAEPFGDGALVIEGDVPPAPPPVIAAAPATPDPVASAFDVFGAAPIGLPDFTGMSVAAAQAVSAYDTSTPASTTTVGKQLDLTSIPSTAPQVLASQIRIAAGTLPAGTEKFVITAQVPEETFAAAHSATAAVIAKLEETYYPGIDVRLHFTMA